MKTYALALASLVSLTPVSVLAFGVAEEIADEFGIQTYQVSRKDDNLYEIFGQSLYVKTQYCYVYTFGERAIVTKSKIIFLRSDRSCRVEGVYRK